MENSTTGALENDAVPHTVNATLEWVWPDEESNSTAVTVDTRTGVLTVLEHTELDEDYDSRHCRQRVFLGENWDELFTLKRVGEDGWAIAPSELDDFIEAAQALEDESEAEST